MNWSEALIRATDEAVDGRKKHEPMANPHDGIARLRGEFEELEAEILHKRHYRHGNPKPMVTEALQVAAVALRIAVQEWQKDPTWPLDAL